MKKIILFIFSLLLSLQGFANNTSKDQPLIVGTTSGYAPFASLSPQGKYEGFDIDIAELLGQKLSRRVVIKDCGNMPGLMIALKQKKIDLLIWAVSITEERMKNIDMVYYQGEKITKLPILFWKTIPEGIQTLEDLTQNSKRSISIESGSFQESILKGYSNAVLKYVDKIDDVLMELKYGKSLAGTLDSSLLPRLQAQHPEIKVLELPIPKDKQSLGNGICISKENPELTAQIKQAILELTEEGKIDELKKKWNLT